jgi:hypothetical protein
MKKGNFYPGGNSYREIGSPENYFPKNNSIRKRTFTRYHIVFHFALPFQHMDK